MKFIKIKKDGTVTKVPIKKIAKAYLKLKGGFFRETPTSEKIDTIILEQFGTPTKKLQPTSYKAILNKSSEISDKKSIKYVDEVSRRKCILYNEMEVQLVAYSKLLQTGLEPYIAKKLYTTSGSKSAMFDKYQLPEAVLSVKQSICDKLHLKVSSVYLHRAYGDLELNISMWIGFPESRIGYMDNSGHTYKRSLRVGHLDSDTKQILETINPPYTAKDKVSTKQQAKLQQSYNALSAEASKLQSAANELKYKLIKNLM